MLTDGKCENATNLGTFVEVITQRPCEESFNRMHQRSAVILIVAPVDNAEGNEPLAEVCAVNFENLMNTQEWTQIPK